MTSDICTVHLIAKSHKAYILGASITCKHKTYQQTHYFRSPISSLDSSLVELPCRAPTIQAQCASIGGLSACSISSCNTLNPGLRLLLDGVELELEEADGRD